jgi:hypothetical protein
MYLLLQPRLSGNWKTRARVLARVAGVLCPGLVPVCWLFEPCR